MGDVKPIVDFTFAVHALATLGLAHQLGKAVLQDADYISAANDQALCGFTDWAVGVEKDLTGVDCGDGSVMPKAGAMSYDIYQIKDGQLYFGDSSRDGHDGSSPTTRPTKINTDMPYKKAATAQ